MHIRVYLRLIGFILGCFFKGAKVTFVKIATEVKKSSTLKEMSNFNVL